MISCAYKYKAILVADVPKATQALLFGDLKYTEEATTDSGLEADSCEDNFFGKSSPLTNENAIMRIVADMTRDIVKLLL
ncbi:Invertase/pectin methylesterase inhibitor domain superfamily [Sesbania bispinosa]|nr:Invertase/pectin methylesterase inhibitor domain superfamily [Sesbania bispinosa]